MCITLPSRILIASAFLLVPHAILAARASKRESSGAILTGAAAAGSTATWQDGLLDSLSKITSEFDGKRSSSRMRGETEARQKLLQDEAATKMALGARGQGVAVGNAIDEQIDTLKRTGL